MTRIPYAPSLLPDELLYSLLGQLVAYNALGSPRTYLGQLFGTKDVIPSPDLPSLLAPLYKGLGEFSPFSSVDDLIDKGTLYPYHRPFLSPEHHERVQKILLYGGGKGLKTILGRVANRFGANPSLRYCIECLKEDATQSGAPYWHRAQQLPGVRSCTIHRVDLIEHLLPSTLADRQRFHLPPCLAASAPHTTISPPTQIAFAELSRDLLNAALPVLPPHVRNTAYKNAAIGLGFRTCKRRIDHEALSAAIQSHYLDFEGFAHRERLLSTRNHPLAWLRNLLDRPERSSHPICHLLLIGFLFGSVKAFRSAIEESVQFTIGCPASSTPVDSAPQDSEDSTRLEIQLLKDSSLSCRAVSKALRLSVTTVVSRRHALGVAVARRPKFLDAAKVSAISEDLKKGEPLIAIASRHKIAISTVYRVRNGSPGLRECHYEALQDQERQGRRKRWLETIKQNSGGGLRKARQAAPETYAWLYRHDKEWLQQGCKALCRPRFPSARVDWAERDASLCMQLISLVASLRTQDDRPRISKSLLLRHLGGTQIRNNLARLPQLRTWLAFHTESTLSFQCYRIDRAIERLVTEGSPIQLWRIQRLAGIHEWTPVLRQHTEQSLVAIFSQLSLEPCATTSVDSSSLPRRDPGILACENIVT